MVITDKERKAICSELGVYWAGLKTYGDMLVVLDALIKARALAAPARPARAINTHELAHEILRHRIIILECENGVKPCGEYNGEPIYNMGEMIGAETIAINQLQDVIDVWLKLQPASTARTDGQFAKLFTTIEEAITCTKGVKDGACHVCIGRPADEYEKLFPDVCGKVCEKLAAPGSVPQAPDPLKDDSRCAICAWPLAESAGKGCVRGNCSQRPFPEVFYDLERANREYGNKFGVPARVPQAEPPKEEK